MYEHNRFIFRAVRMGVILRRLSMSCPACMPDTTGPRHRHPPVCLFRKDLQASLGFHNFDPARLLIAHSNTG